MGAGWKRLMAVIGVLSAVLAVADFYRRVVRRQSLWWGATEEEIAKRLPGDELVAEPALVTTHAVTIDAPPRDVWPWLVQMGPGRGGAYTYDWIENLLGLEMHSADRIVPEWQKMAVGDAFQLSKNGPPFRVAVLEPERALVGATDDRSWSWAFVLEPAANGKTRFITRNRIPLGSLPHRLGLELMLPGAFVMERKMLLGIKERAERLAAERGEGMARAA